MRLTVTPGTGGCQHLTVREQTTGRMVGLYTLDELHETSASGDPLLMQLRLITRGADRSAQAAKAVIEAADVLG